MLQRIQDMIAGWLAWVIVIVISIGFVLWGIETKFYHGGSDSERTYVTVDGEDVTQQTFNRLFQQEKNQFYSANPNLPPNDLIDKQIEKKTLEHVIRMTLLKQYAKKHGLRASGMQIMRELSQYPIFEENGQLSQKLLLQFMHNQGFKTEQELTETLALDHMNQQLINGLLASEFLMDDEFKTWVLVINQARDIQYLVIENELFKDIKSNDEEIKAYYEKHKERFSIPDQVSLEYIQLSLDDVKKDLHIKEEDIVEYYETHKAEYTKPKSWKLAHILIRAKTPDEEITAKEEASKIFEQLKNGGNFSELANKHSQDVLTAKDGGALEWVTKEMVHESIKNVLDQLSNKNDIAGPVKTSAGFEIFKLLDVKESTTLPLDKLKSKIKTQIENDKLMKTFTDLTEQLSELTFNNPHSLAPAAETLGLTVKETESFAANENKEGILSNSKIKQIAFSEDVLQEGNNSELIPLDEKNIIVIRVKQHTPSRLMSLEEAASKIKDMIEYEKRGQQALELGKVLREKMEKGQPTTAEFNKYKLKWVNKNELKRTTQDIDFNIIREVFEIPSNDDHSHKIYGFMDKKGDYVLFKILKVHGYDISSMKEDERKDFINSMMQRYALSEYMAFLEDLKERTTIKIHATDKVKS